MSVFILPAIMATLRFARHAVHTQDEIDAKLRVLAETIGTDEAEAFYDELKQEAKARGVWSGDHILQRLEKKIELTNKII